MSATPVRPVHVSGAAARSHAAQSAATTAAPKATLVAAAALIWLVLWFGTQTAGATPATPVEVWHSDYDGPARLDDSFDSVITAANGDAVVAGYGTARRADGTDVLLARYGADGARRWLRLWDGPAGDDDRARAVAADGSGGFYVVGRVAGRGHDLLVMRYSSTGVLRWFRRYDAGLSRYDEGLFAAVDDAQNVYVVGTSKLSTRLTWRIVKYDRTGRQLWTSSYGSGYEALPTDVAVDGSGRLFVCGTYGTARWLRGVTRAYSPRGRLLWQKTYTDGATTRPSGMALAPDGLYLAVSHLTRDYEPYAARIVKQSTTTGAQIWSAGWTNVPGAAPCRLNDIVVLPSYGPVAVGGFWAFPTMVAGLFGVDANGQNPTTAAWPDPDQDTSNHDVVSDGIGGVWTLGYRFDHLAVGRFDPGSGAGGLFVYAGRLFTTGRALAAQGDAVYVAGSTQNDEGDDTQALLLRVR